MRKTIDIDFFYKSYVDDLYSYARSMGFDKHTSMDAIHDIFYKICTKSTDMKSIQNVKHYLIKSLRNRLLDIYRTKKEFYAQSPEDLSQHIPFNTNITVEEEFILNEEEESNKKEIQNILNNLTARQREIIYLRYLQELEYNEISEIMQIPVQSCRKMIYKTLIKIRESNLSLCLLLFHAF